MFIFNNAPFKSSCWIKLFQCNDLVKIRLYMKKLLMQKKLLKMKVDEVFLMLNYQILNKFLVGQFSLLVGRISNYLPIIFGS